MARAAVIGIAGAGLALAVAYALSPLTPVGLARQAEIDPGPAFNVALLVPCAVRGGGPGSGMVGAPWVAR